mmetsp:Transcript_33185/g.71526  ORF Transcript_33185/g.71526 Transcript_33185/m.71526 type:complete len:234 (+) Transcript_33185:141-842(+)
MHNTSRIQVDSSKNSAQSLMAASQLVMGLLLIFIPSSRCTASSVVLGDDWGADSLDLLMLLLDFLCISLWVGIQPRLTILEGIQNLLLLIGIHLFTETLVVSGAFGGRAHGMDVAVEGVLRINTFLDLLVLIRKLLGLADHLLDLFFRQAALVVGDGDLLALSGALVFCTYVQNAVAVDLKGHFNLWLTTGSRRNPAKLKLAQEVVVFGHGPFTFIDLDVHCWLIVLVCGEDL